MQSLSQQAIEANEQHRNALDNYTRKLQTELETVNKLIAAVDALPDDDIQENPGGTWCLHAAGAFKPASIINIAEAQDPRSPFYEEAKKREHYMKLTTANPFSTSERKYLEKAVVKENKRLAAIRARDSGQNAFEAVAYDNEFFLGNTEGINWDAVARDVSASNYPIGGRTAQECKVRWLGAQHPKIYTGYWYEDDENRLHELVEAKRESGVDWEEIPTLLRTNRSPLDCIRRYQAGNRAVFRWSKNMDKRLVEAVKTHGSNNWVLVAASVSPEVSANQCLIRYERSLKPDIKRGKFSPEEDELLLHAVRLHGSDWVKVAQAVPRRTNAQCRERYKNYLVGWGQGEDDKLKEAVNEHGKNWEKICKEMGSNRPQAQYTARHRFLTRLETQKPTETVDGCTSASLFSTGISSDQVDSPTPAAVISQQGITHPNSTDHGGSEPKADLPEPSRTLTSNGSSATATPLRRSTRERKRKAADMQLGSDDTAEIAGTPVPKKRPRQRNPKPRVAAVAAHQTGADTTTGASVMSAPTVAGVVQALGQVDFDDMSDLTDLTDQDHPAPRKKVRTTPNRSAKRIQKPRVNTYGKPTTSTMGTCSAIRNTEQTNDVE